MITDTSRPATRGDIDVLLVAIAGLTARGEADLRSEALRQAVAYHERRPGTVAASTITATAREFAAFLAEPSAPTSGERRPAAA